jgi:hypothetical protein
LEEKVKTMKTNIFDALALLEKEKGIALIIWWAKSRTRLPLQSRAIRRPEEYLVEIDPKSATFLGPAQAVG